jgi:hypothetical protein
LQSIPKTQPGFLKRSTGQDDTIDIETFGGEFETNEGEKTTLKKLLEESKSGVGHDRGTYSQVLRLWGK